MGRKPIGLAPMTPAQRQELQRQRKNSQAAAWRIALVQIETARTIKEAREIASAALEKTT